MNYNLRCTFCGGPLRVETRDIGWGGDTVVQPEFIECVNGECRAEWWIDGALRERAIGWNA